MAEQMKPVVERFRIIEPWLTNGRAHAPFWEDARHPRRLGARPRGPLVHDLGVAAGQHLECFDIFQVPDALLQSGFGLGVCPKDWVARAGAAT